MKNAVRSIAAVIGGYVAMALWVMLALSLAWTALGPGFAFRDGTTKVSLGWIAVALFTGALGALLGGFVARRIAAGASDRPIQALAAIVLVLGLASALFQPAPQERPPFEGDIREMSAADAATVAEQPRWYPYVIAFVGFFGVLAGGRRRAPGGLPPAA